MSTIIDTSASMSATLDSLTGEYSVYQDERPFLEQAKREREMGQRKDVGYKKACTIPDIVAVDLLFKYGIDVHSETFMANSDDVRRVMRIIKTEYPHLMSY